MNRLLFAKTGRACYISHLDLMRTFQRAFQRAEIPIKHTEGFNPHPFVSILLPLSVGFSSSCELLEFTLLGDVPLEEVPARLNAALPQGVEVLRCWEGGRKAKELALVNYEITLIYDKGTPDGAAETVDKLLKGEKLEVTKKSKRGEGVIDVLPLVKQYSITEREGELRLNVTLEAQNPGLNPQLLVAALAGAQACLAPDFARYHRAGVLDREGQPFL